MKLCGTCQQTKPLDDFYMLRGQPRSICKPCSKNYRQEWRAKNPVAARDHELKRWFNMVPGQFDKMLESQGGTCLGCGASPEEAPRRMSVDHDHAHCPGPKSCGTCLRAILCGPCNHALGLVKDSAETLLRLANVVDLYRVIGEPIKAF